MKRLTLLLALLLVCSVAQAQMADSTAPLKSYALKALPRCPGASLALEPINSNGPVNFRAFTVTHRSTDKHCGGQKYLLYSPKTQQIFLGAVLALAEDTRPTKVRVEQEAGKILGKKITATIAPFPLPDGLKAVTMNTETPFGPFAYTGFVDSSEQFLIVGLRGSLKVDPAQSLREALGIKSGMARKGNDKAKIEIIEFSDFQCPSCARAHEKIDPLVQKNLSKLSYGRMDLPLFEHHNWAVQAAMAARAIQRVAPAKYWTYVDHVFKNQEAISKRPFDKFLQEFIEDHDIDGAAVQKIYASKAERQALLEQVSKAFSAGIAATPTFLVNGQLMGFGPDGTFTVDAIKSALGIPTTPAAAKK